MYCCFSQYADTGILHFDIKTLSNGIHVGGRFKNVFFSLLMFIQISTHYKTFKLSKSIKFGFVDKTIQVQVAIFTSASFLHNPKAVSCLEYEIISINNCIL